jgi:hypothetical protein
MEVTKKMLPYGNTAFRLYGLAFFLTDEGCSFVIM